MGFLKDLLRVRDFQFVLGLIAVIAVLLAMGTSIGWAGQLYGPPGVIVVLVAIAFTLFCLMAWGRHLSSTHKKD